MAAGALNVYASARKATSEFLTPHLTRPLPRSLEQPSPALLSSTGGGLHRFIGLPRWPLLAANRDPTLQEYGAGKPSNNSGVYTIIHTGGQLVRGAE